MNRKKFKKVRNQINEVGIDLNKLESLSRILIHCIQIDENLKAWDIENLSLVLNQKIHGTKQKFNNIERTLET